MLFDRSATVGGLSLSLGGFGLWSHDISGFKSTATPVIYKRWCQFGLLSSHSRLHGSASYRVPWLLDKEACDTLDQQYILGVSLLVLRYLKNPEKWTITFRRKPG